MPHAKSAKDAKEEVEDKAYTAYSKGMSEDKGEEEGEGINLMKANPTFGMLSDIGSCQDSQTDFSAN